MGLTLGVAPAHGFGAHLQLLNRDLAFTVGVKELKNLSVDEVWRKLVDVAFSFVGSGTAFEGGQVLACGVCVTLVMVLVRGDSALLKVVQVWR